MDSPDETLNLISAGKVKGTPVLSAEGETIGEIYDVMLEKRTGKIAYAMMSFGGIFGIGKTVSSIALACAQLCSRRGRLRDWHPAGSAPIRPNAG